MIKNFLRGAALALLPLLAIAQPISQLPGGTTPSGDEWIPAVQNNQTVKLTVAQIATYISGSDLGTPTSIVLSNGTGLPLTTGVIGILPEANGGTGTATPGLVQGTNITITGSWPNQTISASGAALGSANTWTGAQTFDNNTFLLLGTSTGTTTVVSANATSTDYTITVPPITDTLVTLTATQTLLNKSIAATEITGLGTFALQNFATPPALGGTTPNAGAFSSVTDTGITGLVQCVHVNSTGLFSGTGVDCGAGSGGLPSIENFTFLANTSGGTTTPSQTGIAGNLAFVNGNLVTSQTIQIQSGSYTINAGNAGNLLELNSGSAATWTLPAEGGIVTTGYSVDLYNLNVGLLTVVPPSGTINGQTSLTLMYAESCTPTLDSSGNWDVSACTASPRQGTFLGLSSGSGACAAVGSPEWTTYRGQFNCNGTSGVSTFSINLPQAPHGYICNGHDLNGKTLLYQTASSTTSCTLGQTITSGDTVNFEADPF